MEPPKMRTAGLGTGLFTIAAIGSYGTHLWWSVKMLSTMTSAPGAEYVGPNIGQLAIGGVGTFMPPVGMIHGVMIWFGYGF